MNGTFTYSAATNALTASSITSTGGMAGTGQAQFYGPSAEEVGGTFYLTGGTAAEHYQGAFGAKQ